MGSDADAGSIISRMTRWRRSVSTTSRGAGQKLPPKKEAMTVKEPVVGGWSRPPVSGESQLIVAAAMTSRI